MGALLVGITLSGAAATRAQGAGRPVESDAVLPNSPPTAPLPAARVASADDQEVPGSKIRSAPPVSAQPPYSRRAYARGSMFLSYFMPGIYSEYGGERTPAGGLWVGGGLAILNSTLPLPYVPSFRVHTTLGYSGRYVAIGGDLGGGAGYTFFGVGSFDLGFALRLGRVDGVHANLLLYWWLFPSSYPFPTGGEFSLLAPVGTGSWFQWELHGDMRLGIWGGGTLGAKHLISDEPRGSTFITWGVGAAWQVPFPGALIQVGYEYHH